MALREQENPLIGLRSVVKGGVFTHEVLIFNTQRNQKTVTQRKATPKAGGKEEVPYLCMHNHASANNVLWGYSLYVASFMLVLHKGCPFISSIGPCRLMKSF